MMDIPNLVIVILQFYTTWNIILVLFHKWTHKYVDLLLSSTLVMVVGWGVVHLNSTYTIRDIHGDALVIRKDPIIMCLDILSHTLPFLFVYSMYSNYYKNSKFGVYQAIAAFMITIAYLLTHEVTRIYGLTPLAMTCLLCIGFLFYIWLKA